MANLADYYYDRQRIMRVFSCHVCRTSLSADDAQVGQLVRCPTCLTAIRVPVIPASEPIGAAVSAGAAASTNLVSAPPPSGIAARTMGLPRPRAGGRQYGFNCPYCSSRLEASESIAAQEGQCPTCGNQITVPILDRYGRLIDPKTMQIIKQDPHPVHAYAAAGDRAPTIVRIGEGKRGIRCPRCNATSPITVNNCKTCGMPFTMEGTTLEAAGANNGYCVASLVLGIIGLIPCPIFIAPLLALIFGIIGYNQVSKISESKGRGSAIAGIALGAIGMLEFLSFYIFR